MDNNFDTGHKGWLGLILTALSWMATAFSFAIENATYITLPMSIAVSLFAIRYYSTATKALKNKK